MDYVARLTGTTTEESANASLQGTDGTTETATVSATDTIDSREASMIWQPYGMQTPGAYLWVTQLTNGSYQDDETEQEDSLSQTVDASRQQVGTISENGNVLSGNINRTDVRSVSDTNQNNGSAGSSGTDNVTVKES